MSAPLKSVAAAKPWSFVSGSQWSRPPPQGQAPSARCGHTTTKAGTRLYLFGGWSGTNMLCDLYILDPDSMVWSRPTAIGKAPRPRAGHTCTAIGPAPQTPAERMIAQQRAVKASDSSSPRKQEDETTCDSSQTSVTPPNSLSASTNSSGCSQMLNGWEDNGSLSDANGCSATTNVAQPSQRLLIFGGGDNDGLMNDLHLLEVDTLTWSPVFTAGSSPSPRSRHSATLVKSTLWVIGGLGEGQVVFNDVYTLSINSMVWTKPSLKGTPMSPRWGHSAIRSGSLIIIFGGHSGAEVMNDLHILDTETCSWRVVETMSLTTSAITNGRSLLSSSSSSLPPMTTPNTTINGTPGTPGSVASAAGPGFDLPPVAESETEPPATDSPRNTYSDTQNNEKDGQSYGSTSANGTLSSAVTSPATSSPYSTNNTVSNTTTNNTTNNNISSPSAMPPQAITSTPSNPPTPRCGHSANFVLLGRERKMVVFGGSNAAGDVFNDTFILDLDTFQWLHLNIKGSLPSARSVHSCNTVDDRLFVIGGIDSTRRFKDIYTLSLTGLAHVEDPSMAPVRGRPRRSSRASPRVHSLVSPTTTTTTTSTTTVGTSSSPSTPSGMPSSPISAPTNHPQLLQQHHQQFHQHRKSMDELRSDPASSLMSQLAHAPHPLSVSIPPNHLLSSSMDALPLFASTELSIDPVNSKMSPHAPPNGHFASPIRQRGGSNVNSNILKRSAGTSPITHLPTTPTSQPLAPNFLDSPHRDVGCTTLPTPTTYAEGGSGRNTFSCNGEMVMPNSPHAAPNLTSPVAVFLANLGLSRLVPKFEAEEIDMSVLPYLTEENMEYLGVNTLGARLRLSNAIQALKVNQLTPTAASNRSTSPMRPSNHSSNSSNGNNHSHAPHSPFAAPHALSHSLTPFSSPSSMTTQPPALPQQQHTTSGVEALEASVERLINTVLVATSTLTDTMQVLATKLNRGSPSPHTSNGHHKTVSS